MGATGSCLKMQPEPPATAAALCRRICLGPSDAASACNLSREVAEMAAQASPGPRTPQSARQLSARSQGDLNDDWLFNAPAELVSARRTQRGKHRGSCSGGSGSPLPLSTAAGSRLHTSCPRAAHAPQVCPLTLAPFIDPVLTSAGHVSRQRVSARQGARAAVGRRLALQRMFAH